ncbi:MAG: glycosyltransferase involved in cell wall biosynthesis [Verrucomicrobiales bacterium]
MPIDSPLVFSVISPYPVELQTGNSVSARRIAARLKSAGIAATATFQAPDTESTGIIAINAWRLRKTVQQFRTDNPRAPIIVVLAGSDLYGSKSEEEKNETVRAMDIATALVVSQSAALDAIPNKFRAKSHVIAKSVDDLSSVTVTDACQDPNHFIAIVLSNLRSEKVPLLAGEALHFLPKPTTIRVHHYGEPIDPELAQQAELLTENSDGHYQWHGGIEHPQAMQALTDADAFINSSNFEGGANAVCEAIALGTPVLATDIPGNVGILGADYPGLFAKGDATALARLLSECAQRGTFLASLEAHCAALASSFAPEVETALWRRLIADIVPT